MKQTIKRTILLLIILFSAQQVKAQSYIQIRAGTLTTRYEALDPDVLDRDEHDFIRGRMIDFEYGKEYGKSNITFLLGVRLQYNYQKLKGNYTKFGIEPNVDIDTHATAAMITVGTRIKLVDNLSALIQSNIGVRRVFWYQNSKHTNTFWKFYLPINTGLEYKLYKNWNLVGGFSFRPPLYKSQTYKYYIGFRKSF